MLKILMRNRSDALQKPGGDTVLMERMRDGLQSIGHRVEFDLDFAADVRRYDLVHLFNLTLPDLIRPMAIEASAHGVPFVIHALQEDWPRFYNRALAAAIILEKYVSSGQPRDRLASALAMLRECPAAEKPLCPEAARAATILCTGEEEARLIGLTYPGTRTDVVHLAPGVVNSLDPGGPGEFRRAYGVEDFVLCVGRLEPRKNQLALLAALEDEDIPVVFADGGFSYAAEYASACRKFARRGRTLFTGRLSPQMLHSAHCAARVSCFPSWYELPGLAALEAACLGRNMVASPWGTLPDYLGNACRYVEPDDLTGLRKAVLEAWESPPSAALRSAAARFTWEKTVQAVESVYLRAAEGRNPVQK